MKAIQKGARIMAVFVKAIFAIVGRDAIKDLYPGGWKRPRYLAHLAAALAVVAAPVTAEDWRYFGTYPSQEEKWYMSFYDPESVHKISDSIVTVTVRTVWTKTLDAYWKKHGDDDDLVEAGARKMNAKDFSEYFSLADIKKKYETNLLNQSLMAIGNEFIVSKKNVPARADITWKIYCTKYIFVNMSTIVYKTNGQVERVLEVPVPELNKIGPRSEMEYLRQLTCKRIT
jgi:hypothetical protein